MIFQRSEWSLNLLLIFQQAEQVDAAVYCGRFDDVANASLGFLGMPWLLGDLTHRLSANGSIPCLHRPHLRLHSAFFRRALDRCAENDVQNEH